MQMQKLGDFLKKRKVVLYGLSTETERVIKEWKGRYEIIGLLDGFLEEGEEYGLPILKTDSVVKQDNVIIVIVARPGSVSAITSKIGDLCRANNVPLFDIRGNDCLLKKSVAYDYSGFESCIKTDFLKQCEAYDVISFDLFDTLITRKVLSSEDVIELVKWELIKKEIDVPKDFCKRRIQIEKELSKEGKAPKLKEIYELVFEDTKKAEIGSEAEFMVELKVSTQRAAMVEFFSEVIIKGKTVYITSDTYYSKREIEKLLSVNSISGYEALIISCEEGTSKSGRLYEILKNKNPGQKILHIGDDLYSDYEKATAHGISCLKIYSPKEMFENLGYLGMQENINSLSDRIKAGLFVSKVFNNPFIDSCEKVSLNSFENIGFSLVAPILLDFVLWLKKMSKEKNLSEILLCARDGYLIKQLYDLKPIEVEAKYYLTSRICAIRSGVKSLEDLEYVNSMKYSGSLEDCLKTRFGIDYESLEKSEIDENKTGLLKFDKKIFKQAEAYRKNNIKYIEGLKIKKGNLGFFDFVAKGTVQMFSEKLIDNPLYGLYFILLEPEFMKDKNLNIFPFVSNEEKDKSTLFEDYYILETILSSDMPSLESFTNDGTPKYSKETRSFGEIEGIMKIQRGILCYAKSFYEICPEKEERINRALDEKMLGLIHRVSIKEDNFKLINVEDPFFGRNTNVMDII